MRIAFIGFGEVASAFSAARRSRCAHRGLRCAGRSGARQRKAWECRSARFLTRYTMRTMFFHRDDERRAPRRGTMRPRLRPGQHYVDLNATDPDVKKEIQGIIEPSRAAFVEGALLGAVGVTGAKTEILLGGPAARRAEQDLAGTLGLNARFYSEEIGKASMFKMLRSVFSKGMEALLIEFLAAGERAGIRDDLWKEVTGLFATQPFEKVAANWVRSHASAHERRYHEVKQVAAVLRALGIEPTITAATEAFFCPASLGLVPAASMDEVVRRFNERL